MEIPIKMDDLGGNPTIFGNTHIYIYINVPGTRNNQFKMDGNGGNNHFF